MIVFGRLLSASALIVLTVAKVQAGDGPCVWYHLPKNITQRALAAGFEGGPGALSASISPDQMLQAEKICGLTAKNAVPLRKAEAGYMLQVLSEQWLLENGRISTQQLSGAWITMEKKAKARMERWAVTLNHDPEGYSDAYQSFVTALGNPAHLPSDSKPKVLTYLQGRALREIYEPQF
jgi:hypothetical protein